MKHRETQEENQILSFDKKESKANKKTYEKWLKMDSWHIDNAIYLLLGRDPDKIIHRELYLDNNNKFSQEYLDIRDVAQSSIKVKNILLAETVLPEQFITWAKSKKYKVPKAFEEFKHVDLQKDLEQKQKEFSQYIAHNNTFTEETSKTLQYFKEKITECNKNLDKREKKSMLKIIGGLIKIAYEDDVTPTELNDDLSEKGIEIDTDTVSKYINAAKELLEQKTE
jgi:hypothetical protein